MSCKHLRVQLRVGPNKWLLINHRDTVQLLQTLWNNNRASTTNTTHTEGTHMNITRALAVTASNLPWRPFVISHSRQAKELDKAQGKEIDPISLQRVCCDDWRRKLTLLAFRSCCRHHWIQNFSKLLRSTKLTIKHITYLQRWSDAPEGSCVVM